LAATATHGGRIPFPAPQIEMMAAKFVPSGRQSPFSPSSGSPPFLRLAFAAYSPDLVAEDDLGRPQATPPTTLLQRCLLPPWRR
jgi:hypothetical protein